MARHEAAQRVGWLSSTTSPDTRYPPAGQGIAQAVRAIEQDGCAGRPFQIARVQRQREISRMGEPSGSVATSTREGYGCPVSRSSVARDALSAVRTRRAAAGRLVCVDCGLA
jgi:hypothetical protein